MTVGISPTITRTKHITRKEVDPLTTILMMTMEPTTSMSLGIKSIRRKRQATRNQRQIVMPPGLQMIAVKSRKIRESNQATKIERSTINKALGGETGIENQMPEKKLLSL